MNAFASKPVPSRSSWWILAGLALIAVVVWGALAMARHPAATKAGTAPAAAPGRRAAPPPPPGGQAPRSTGGSTVLDM